MQRSPLGTLSTLLGVQHTKEGRLSNYVYFLKPATHLQSSAMTLRMDAAGHEVVSVVQSTSFQKRRIGSAGQREDLTLFLYFYAFNCY